MPRLDTDLYQRLPTPTLVFNDCSTALDNSCSPCSLSDAVLLSILRGDPVLTWQDTSTLADRRALGDCVQQLSLDITSVRKLEHGRQLRIDLQTQARSACTSALKMRRQQQPAVPSEILRKHKLQTQQHQDHYNRCRAAHASNELREAELELSLLQHPPPCLKGFPFLYKREWKSKSGTGDLVFTDGQGLFAVIEVKHIGNHNCRELKRQKRKKVKDQACRYGQEFADQHPFPEVVLAGSFTEVSASVNWVELPCQKLAAVGIIADVAAITEPYIKRNCMLDRLAAQPCPSADQSSSAVRMTGSAASKPMLPQSDELGRNQPADKSDNLGVQSASTMSDLAKITMLVAGGSVLFYTCLRAFRKTTPKD